ncbi:MAG: InlB B-repeat-containing protein [Bacilli bacterium]|jgi:uncharacterized repeat protein (TIGR02543 family)|nr:InlB B-repeat-containing protein [Bacilli bacterium]
MNKKMRKLLVLPLLLLSACQQSGGDTSSALSSAQASSNVNVALGSMASWEMKQSAVFLYNYKKINFALSDYPALTNDMKYLEETLSLPCKVSEPVEPTRANYEFKGWFLDAEGTKSWDFASQETTSSLFFYASWAVKGEDSYVEPAYTPKVSIDDTLTSLLRVDQVLNSPVNSGGVNLTSGGIKRLEAKKDDCRFALQTTKKTGTELTEATYDVSKKIISLKATNGTSEETYSINVTDVSSSYVMSSGTYEAKAADYEESGAETENYHIMLAGSSSIEFWANSTSDLAPIVSYNHGIGGTTIQDWQDKLNERLVFPYMPKAVVYYVGVNDLVNSKLTNDVIIQNAKTLIQQTHTRLPETHIFYVLINLLPGYYLDYSSRIKAIDEEISNFIAPLDYVETIDAGKALLKENAAGEMVADAAYFRLDNLHMSEYGYVLWANEIKKALKNWLG